VNFKASDITINFYKNKKAPRCGAKK